MSVQIDWQPIEGKRASEAIYEQLRRQITSGRLKPGDRLPSERAMMQQLGRSRPTIREALRMLEQGGYVSSTHGASGAVVQELTLDGVEQPLTEMIQLNQISLEELGEYREVNDSTIAGWAAQRRTDEDIAALEKNIVRYGASVADIEALHVIDEEFHSILAAASHNAMVVAVNSAITEIIVTYFWNRAREFSSQKILHINQMAYEAHAALARAVISGDLEDAEKQMQRVNRAFHDATQ